MRKNLKSKLSDKEKENIIGICVFATATLLSGLAIGHYFANNEENIGSLYIIPAAIGAYGLVSESVSLAKKKKKKRIIKSLTGESKLEESCKNIEKREEDKSL